MLSQMHRSLSFCSSTHTPTQPLAAHCFPPAIPSRGCARRDPQGSLRPVAASSTGSSSKPAGSESTPGSTQPASSSKKQPNVVPRDFYSSPWNSNTSAPGAAATGPQPDPDNSKAGSGDENDPWKDVLSTGHTLSSLYLQQFEVEPFKQRDWEAKRQANDLKEVQQAAARLGAKADVIEANLQQLQGLVPGLQINLDKMKSSDWAKLLRDVDSVVAVVITLKTQYPKVDLASLITRKPRLLLATQAQVLDDAAKVKSILGSRVQDIDSIIDAVPDLMNPQQLTQSLGNLKSWFPNQDPFELLQQNPQILENPNVEADPTYGSQVYAEPP